MATSCTSPLELDTMHGYRRASAIVQLHCWHLCAQISFDLCTPREPLLKLPGQSYRIWLWVRKDGTVRGWRTVHEWLVSLCSCVQNWKWPGSPEIGCGRLLQTGMEIHCDKSRIAVRRPIYRSLPLSANYQLPILGILWLGILTYFILRSNSSI